MRDINQGMTFYEVSNPTKEVLHIDGNLPIPRVGELVHSKDGLIGRVKWIEYHYIELSTPFDDACGIGVYVSKEL